jgi:hypothetical protein
VAEHPVQLSVDDDLLRSRLTVFFRLILAIPHFIWVLIFSLAAFVVLVFAWFAALITGRVPSGAHAVLGQYMRYTTHLGAYLTLVADPYPAFAGDQWYPVDVSVPAIAPQKRLSVLFRLPLLLPAWLVTTAFSGGVGSAARRGSSRGAQTTSSGGVLVSVAVLGWFASLVRGRMPKGLRDAGAYVLGYDAHVAAYALLLTDAYPNSDPWAMLTGVEPPPLHPVHLVGDSDDLRRSRVTVLFRIVLAIPLFVWYALWAVLALLAAIVQWFATLVTGKPVAAIHGFHARFVRYEFHFSAFVYLTANPFPGFTGEAGRYPIDVELPGPARQNRWTVAFRIILAIPALIFAGSISAASLVGAVLMWFYALARGSAPFGLRNLSAYALRYSAQTYAYVFFVTDAYPHASPLEGAAPPAQVSDAVA